MKPIFEFFKKNLSTVGFEPTPDYSDQNTQY